MGISNIDIEKLLVEATILQNTLRKIIVGNLTATRIPFALPNGMLTDDSSFVWDNVNKRLGLGLTPTISLDVAGNIRSYLSTSSQITSKSSGSTAEVIADGFTDTGSYFQMKENGTTKAQFFYDAVNNQLKIRTSGAEALSLGVNNGQNIFLATTGYTGFGTTTPQGLIEAASSGGPPRIIVRNTAEAVNQLVDFDLATGSGAIGSTNGLAKLRAKIKQADPSALKSELQFFVNTGDSLTQAMTIDNLANLNLETHRLQTTQTGITEVYLENTGLRMKNIYPAGGWARSLLTYANSANTFYYSIGAYGAGQVVNYGFLGDTYIDSLLKWSTLNTVDAVNRLGINLPSANRPLETVHMIGNFWMGANTNYFYQGASKQFYQYFDGTDQQFTLSTGKSQFNRGVKISSTANAGTPTLELTHSNASANTWTYTSGIAGVTHDALTLSDSDYTYIIFRNNYTGFGVQNPTATLHLKAGTTSASTSPLKFTSGDLMTNPEAGAVEFLTDKFYVTETTGTTRKEIKVVDKYYAEMYEYENTNLTTIGTQDVYHAVNHFVTGLVSGFTFVEGIEGSFASVSDYSGTVTGTILITDTAHGLLTGDIITIHNSTDYNGTYSITKVTDDTFYVTKTYVATNTGDWAMGSYLRCSTGSAGVYKLSLTLTCFSASANQTFKFELNKNTTSLDNVAVSRRFSNTDYGSLATAGLVSLAEGDRIWVSTKNQTSNTDITIRHANLNISRE